MSNLGVEVVGELKDEYLKILTYDALEFLADLHRRFNYTRKQVLKKRMQIQQDINAGKKITYPEGNHDNNNWKVAPVPHDLQMRHVEITGPTDCKMVINALNSGADVFMADFEDSLSPSWKNVIEGQLNLLAANSKNIVFTNPDGKMLDFELLKYTKRCSLIGSLLTSECCVTKTKHGWEETNVLIGGMVILSFIVFFGNIELVS